MSQIELAVDMSRRLESLLEKKHQASGKGLHEKVSSVESQLPDELVKSLRYIATIRNSVVHQEGFVIEDEARFKERGNAALAQLGEEPASRAEVGGATIGNLSLDQVRVALVVVFVFIFAGAGAGVALSSFGGIQSGVLGFIGGAVLGMYLVSIMRKVVEFLIGLIGFGCAIFVISALFKFLG